MMITQTLLDALRITFDARFSQAYEATPTWYDKLCTTIPSTGKSNRYGFKAQQARMQQWTGPRVAQNLSEHVYDLDNLPFEATIELDRDDVEDDTLGIFTAQTIPDLAQAARKHPDQLLKALLQGSESGFDAVSLFNNSHPCYDSASSTYDNLHTQDLDADGVSAVYAGMASITGENGDPLEIMPNLLIVPPQLKRHALVVANSTTYAVPGTTGASATVDNPLKGWFEVLCVPELANEPNVWYMADTTKAMKPFVYQLRRAAQLVSRDQANDPKVFDQKKFTYGVDCRDNVGIGLPFLIAKATHTP